MRGTIHGGRGYVMLRTITLIAALMILSVPSSLKAGDDVLFKAMHDELERSMTKLQLADLDKPYFIAYTIQDGANWKASASLGSLLDKAETRARFLTVEVRVGNRTLDNTNFFSSPFGATGVVRMFGGTVRLPLEDDYQELRRQIWLATDGAYKKALEDISRKRAALRDRMEAEQIPDFSQEQPVQIREEAPPVVANLEEAARLAKEISAVFTQMPEIFTSKLRLGVSNVRTLYVNSEGSSFTRTSPTVSLVVLAATQAPDGMPLQDFVAIYAHAMGELPGKEILAARVREMGERLQKLRNAPLLDRYNGPVLFEGQAAAEVFSQILAPRFLAVRRPVAESPQVESYLGTMDNPFLDKLGARVLPEFLSVVDNATLPEFKQTRLMGSYQVDDEGVRARETKLVENGILKTLLAARSPVSGIAHSTGNWRSSGVLPSNLIVSTEKGVSDEEMREQFFKLVKQRGKAYGIVVRRLGNPAFRAAGDQMYSTFTQPGQSEEKVTGPILAYRVYPDGREELIRGTEIAGLSAAAFRDIAAASSTQTVYSCPFASRALSLYSSFTYFDTAEGEPGAPLVSFVVPALLFEDLTVKKPNDQIPKPPLSKPPLAEK
jgi:hypothetical protein